MAQFKFEGDFDNISERQLEFINKVILEQDLNVNKVVFSPVGQAGDNFVANIKRILVEGDNGNLSIIAKIAPTNEMIRKTTNCNLMFNNEHTMYTEVLPKFVQLQVAAGVPEEEHFRFAKCYGSLLEIPYETILLEDLNVSNYTMLDKFESLSDKCVKSILKNFATLHSLSHALKKTEPETYDLFKEKLVDGWSLMADSIEFQQQMEYLELDILSAFDDETHKSIIRHKITDLIKQTIKLVKQENYKHSVIQQGDAWTNNVMFRFEEDKVESIMIDYQLSKSNNPVADLLYMIFNCTDHETRSKHYYNWIDYYHLELEESLSNFGLKANFVYPRDQLDADLKRYGKFVFGQSLILASVLTRDSKEAGQLLDAMKNEDVFEAMQTMKIQDLKSETTNRLKKRVVGLIDSFTEFGLL